MYLIHYNKNHDPKTGRFTYTTFISGSSKTQNQESPYYRKELPKTIRTKIDSYMKSGDKIIIGDAPGIDRQVQDYLNKNEWRAEKDILMSKIADRGLAIVLENGGAGATRDNVQRLIDAHKDVYVYELSTKGDKWIKSG